MFGQGFNSGFFIVASGANTFASENFNTVLYTGNGSTQRIGGYINRGAVFNGSTSYISDVVNIGVGDSLSVWFQQNTDTVRIYTNYDGTYDFFAITIEYDGTSQHRVRIFLRNDTGTYRYVNTDYFTLTGGWHHFALNINSFTSYTAYIDGAEVTFTGTTSGSTPTTHPTSNNRAFGRSYINGSINYCDIKLDQIRIFNKALSSSEVTTLYGETHSSTTISTTDIFNDDSGVALYQLDGNANDTGGASGRLAGTEAAIFNSTDNSNFNLGTATVLDNNFGISFWTKINKINTGGYGDYLFAFMYGQNFQAVIKPSGLLRIDFGSISADCSFNTSHTFTEGVWYHIAITGTYTSSPGTVTVYVNGSSVGSGSNINGHNTSANYGNRIGSYHNATDSIDGQIEEFRIYKSTSLSTSDITALYSGTPPTTGLTNYFKFNGNDRNYASDRQLTPTNVIYAYDGTASNVTYQEATKFQPDFVWIKKRTDDTKAHRLFDSVRGAGNVIYSNLTNAEASPTNELTSFDSNGFTVGSASAVNDGDSADSFVAWCFKGGNSTVSDTSGDVTASVSANTASGFSIVKYNDSSTSQQTVSHGLNAAPSLIITKEISNSNDWIVYTTAIDGSMDFLRLNTTDAASGSGLSVPTTDFIYSRGSSSDIINYCFHDVADYQKIGSYTGTGATGNIVETGFEPAFLLIKNASNANNEWNIIDNKRDTENPRDVTLWVQSTATEATASQSGAYDVNFLSNGFSVENTYNPFNASGQTYLYLAIAADPDTSTPTVENSFDVVTYTGDDTTNRQINVDFKPDFIWVKNRSAANNHTLVDSIRGANNLLFSDSTSATLTSNTTLLSSINDSGFTVGYDGTDVTNGANNNYVAWCWKAGDHDKSLPQINTEGNIDSIVSVNDAAGFSIVKFNGASGANTVGHGLSQAPELFIMKSANVSGTWGVYVKDLGADKYLTLNSNASTTTSTGVWNNTHPTSTVLHWQGGLVAAGGTGQYDNIAYCWYSVSGHSKIGTYSGGQASTSIIPTGFEPSWVMIKNTTNAHDWCIFDNRRDAGGGYMLEANDSATESQHSDRQITFVSTGFKINATTSLAVNLSSNTYLYMAFK